MKKITKIISYIFLFVLAFITLFPFVYMILASLMSYIEVTSIPPTLFPKTLMFSNYAEAMKEAPFVRYFINTIFTSLTTTIGTLITTILAGFAIVKLNFAGKKWLILLFSALMMVPHEITVFTNFQTIAKAGLLDTYQALIFPYLASIFYIFYMKSYLENVDIAFYKAAKVNGCSDLEYIWRILIPMSKPALFTVGILSFISGWNSFLWPILVTNTKEMRLISNGLSAFSSEAGTQYQLQMAASTITIIPILILYFAFRKQIMNGVSRSGLKG